MTELFKYKDGEISPILLKLKVDSDLSSYAYTQATDLICDWELMSRDLLSENSLFLPINERLFFTLYVDIWNSSQAIAIMANHKNCDIVIEKYRKVDSWKVTASDTGHNCRAYVECEGA